MTSLTIDCDVHFGNKTPGRKTLVLGTAPAVADLGRVTRVAKLMALAIRFEGLIRQGSSRITRSWPAWAM